MRYLLLIYEEPPASPPTPEQWAEMMPLYNAFTAWLNEQGWNKGGEALHDVDSATTVRVRDGRALTTDGPFAETKEQLTGYFVIDAPALDEALNGGHEGALRAGLGRTRSGRSS